MLLTANLRAGNPDAVPDLPQRAYPPLDVTLYEHMNIGFGPLARFSPPVAPPRFSIYLLKRFIFSGPARVSLLPLGNLLSF
jgi:hypothetical protein